MSDHHGMHSPAPPADSFVLGQRRLEEKLRLVEVSARLGFWDAELPSWKVYYSPGYKAILGYAEDELPDATTLVSTGGAATTTVEAQRCSINAQQTFLERLHPDDRDRVSRELDDCATGDATLYESEFRLRHRDGSYRWILSRALIQRDGKGVATGLTGIHLDITDARENAARLSRADEALSKSSKELEQFCYVVSHDLQEPLRMISSYVQLLSRRYRQQLDPEGAQFIEFAVGGAKRMSRLINDLLRYSRLGRPLGAPAPVDCGQVVEQALAGLQLMVQEASATITVSPLPTVSGDAVQIGQLFQNLIQNALKYRGERPPHVAISAERKDGEWLFRVQDNGIGIDPRYFERIFLIFQRGEEGRNRPGTGIGLAVAKRVVENHGGRIWVESRPGAGAAFYFTLPAGA